MPKVTIDNTRGLVQARGSGVTITSDVTISGAATFSGSVTGVSNTALTVGVDLTTAAAGSTAGDAAALPSGSTMYTITSDGDGKGVKIAAADAASGRVLMMINEGNNKCKVYPNTGATIDGTTSFTLEKNKPIMVGYYGTNKWFVLESS